MFETADRSSVGPLLVWGSAEVSLDAGGPVLQRRRERDELTQGAGMELISLVMRLSSHGRVGFAGGRRSWLGRCPRQYRPGRAHRRAGRRASLHHPNVPWFGDPETPGRFTSSPASCILGDLTALLAQHPTDRLDRILLILLDPNRSGIKPGALHPNPHNPNGQAPTPGPCPFCVQTLLSGHVAEWLRAALVR